MADRRSCLQRASDPTFRRESVVVSLQERHDIAELEGSPDGRYRPSVRGKPRGHGQPNEGSQAIRHQRGVALPRTIPPSHRHPSRPESADRHRQQRTTCHDHDVWSRDKPSAGGQQPDPPGGGVPAAHSRNRRHLPEVPCLSTKSDVPIVDTLDCLPSAFRSQGFSPSQRFDPGTPSWLCFKPHPSVGFMGLQSLFRRGQP